MLMNAKSMLGKAKKCRYAVPAFNINDLEMLKGVVSACRKERSPVIIQTTENAIKYAGLNYLAAIMKQAAKQEKIPIVIHLDHGKSIDMARRCIKAGYNSVMIDASRCDFDNNVKITKKVVALAKSRASVEAELGRIIGKEEKIGSDISIYTDPEKSEEFVKKTKIDSLAVAIGTKHGLSKKEIKHGFKKKRAKLRFDILKNIAERVNIPLVLHGGSDLTKIQLRKCIKLGITKINIDTDLRVAFTSSEKEFIIGHKKEYDPRKVLEPAILAVENAATEKIKIFGSSGKA